MENQKTCTSCQKAKKTTYTIVFITLGFLFMTVYGIVSFFSGIIESLIK